MKTQKPMRATQLLSSLLLFSSAAYGLGSFDIVIDPGSVLAGNADALAAFNRAAATWESYLADPITVTITADLSSMGSSTIIGNAGSVILVGDYTTVRDAMVADGAGDSVITALPTFSQANFTVPTGFGLTGNLGGTKANLKALGFTGLDSAFGASDATITFNTDFSFDYNRSNGIGAGMIDFESVALHEIGHALGFISAVDDFDQAINAGLTSGNADIYTLDMYRFADGTVNDPSTLADFTTAERNLVPGTAAVIDDLSHEYALSTGAYNGDGRQASHWKDGDLTGTLIGTMDPTIGYGQIFTPSTADLRALDLIGWDVVPEPMTAWFITSAGMVTLARRRRATT
jgi:hypothetical protein